MNANELRVGNYVNIIAEGHENKPDLLKWGIDDFDFHKKRMNNIQGVPLTERWILDLAFKLIDGYYEINTTSVFQLLHKGNNHYNAESIDIVLCDLYYVHDLQNFYFAIERKELI